MISTTIATEPAAASSVKEAASDVYHGVTVVDDHRWLEESSELAVRDWSAKQNALSREYLDGLPDRAGIAGRLTELFDKVMPSYIGLVSRPGQIFALKFQPPKQQRILVRLSSADQLETEKVVIDPNLLEPTGQVAMDWFVPSPDGKLVAVCLSEDGSEEGALHFFETETGKALPETIARVQYPTGGGSAAWAPDGKSIYYTRYPRKGERPDGDLNFYEQIYHHKMGTPDSADTYSAGRDFPRIAEIHLETSRDGRWLVAQVANGDGGEYAHHLKSLEEGASSPWQQVTNFEDGVKEVQCAGAVLYLRSVKAAPRGRILSMPLDAALKDATIVVAEGEAVIEGFELSGAFLYVREMIGGPSRLRRFDLFGKNGVELPTVANTGIGAVLVMDEYEGDSRVLIYETKYTEPAAWYLYDPKAGSGAGGLRKTAMTGVAPVDFSDIEVVREYAVSKDGTKVPLNILRRKGTELDSNNPTLLYGYGGYGHVMRPQYDFSQRLFFDRGGVYVVANIRGGGEYGEQWHLQGNLLNKQNVFDDFAACARHLIERGYTQPAKLAIEGGSNGGLLMGVMLTQHPQLMRAVVSHVGIYDMVRVELDPNGAFNITEFGSVTDPEQFKVLRSYSPYHNVVKGTAYPAVFFLAGETDGRVNPAHTRKMTASLQAANGGDSVILARLSADSGHGMGTALSERIAQRADVLAFLYDQLGMRPVMIP